MVLDATMAPPSSNNSNSPTAASNGPSEALIRLSAPDGYYEYLGIVKPMGTADGGSSGGSVDIELVRKNYRKLSLKHHPDRPNGDADTFRLLNRAQRVLLHPRLRQEYDMLGLDLDDDAEETMEESSTSGNETTTPPQQQQQQQQQQNQSPDDEGKQKTESDNSTGSASNGVLHEMASQALTYVMQLAIRTLTMATVSILLVRYRLTLYPVLAFLTFVAYRIRVVSRASGGNIKELLPPLLIAVGLIIMHRARRNDQVWSTTKVFWSFWFGESLVITIFTLNSLTTFEHFHKRFLWLALIVGGAAIVLALWLRGKFWNYALILGLEVVVGTVVALAFPIMEVLLESIINDKLRKVGDKVRAHHQQLEAYYQNKINQSR